MFSYYSVFRMAPSSSLKCQFISHFTLLQGINKTWKADFIAFGNPRSIVTQTEKSRYVAFIFYRKMNIMHQQSLPFVAFNLDLPSGHTPSNVSARSKENPFVSLSLKQVHTETGIVMVQPGRSPRYSAHRKKKKVCMYSYFVWAQASDKCVRTLRG